MPFVVYDLNDKPMPTITKDGKEYIIVPIHPNWAKLLEILKQQEKENGKT